MVNRIKEILRHRFVQFGELRAEISSLARQTIATGRRVETIGHKLEEMQREQRLMWGAVTVPDTREWRGKPDPAVGAASPQAFPNSTICRQESFLQPYFPYWTAQIGHSLRYHRKLWEFVFICQALYERNGLQAGARGLGFGVGEEPLSAYFASKGIKVTATDMAPEAAAAAGWTETAQHAHGKEALKVPWVCSDALFDANVEFKNCDMNHISPEFRGYDFCWSACALEHVGSIELGLKFIENSLETLRPGGLAIHTTEFNMSSNEQTLDNIGTVLFRKRDLEELGRRLEAKGHIMAPLDLTPGYLPIDRYIDMPPYLDEPHLRMSLDGFATTSIGLIVQKKAE